MANHVTLDPPARPGSDREAAEPSSPLLTILAVSPSKEVQQNLQDIFQQTNWRLKQAYSYHEALIVLCSERMPVILCECSLPDGNWKDIVSQMAPVIDRPRLIVTSPQTDERLATEVRLMGGYDILPRPFDPNHARELVVAAWRDWQDSWQQMQQSWRMAQAGGSR